jgi:hypothetical protein
LLLGDGQLVAAGMPLVDTNSPQNDAEDGENNDD